MKLAVYIQVSVKLAELYNFFSIRPDSGTHRTFISSSYVTAAEDVTMSIPRSMPKARDSVFPVTGLFAYMI